MGYFLPKMEIFPCSFNFCHSTNLQYKLEIPFSILLDLSNPLKLQIQLKFRIDP